MSICGVTYYRVICDWPDCEAIAGEESEYAPDWSDKDYAVEQASEGDWWIERNEKRHYCNGHPAAWASDHELGEPFPDLPYLLIHDGDTDSRFDDSKVSLIEADPCLTPESRAWTDWLASTGYGVDYGSATPPPCTLRDLAEAYHRDEPECSVDEWASCITANTGVFDNEESPC